MIIIGLDVSTTITGIAVLKDGKLVHSESVRTDKRDVYPDVFAIAERIKESLDAIKKDYTPDHIFVEENLKAFSRGFSSATTLIKLAKMNALACYMCRLTFGITPEPIMPSSARKEVSLTIPRGTKGDDTKRLVLEWVSEKEPDFAYDLTWADNPVPGTYDRADAIVISRAGESIVKSKSENT